MSRQAGAELVDTSGGRKFRLIRKLGSGGFAEVWLASASTSSGIERLVAFKLLHGAGDEDIQAVRRLEDEARMLASLRHPVILGALDLVQLGDELALVAEYVDGEDLRAALRHKTHPLPIPALIEVVSQVASALGAAWTQLGIVHRDVKPPNIRVGRYGDVKLLDFGIARSAVMERAAESSLAVVGSPRYLAPERFLLEHPAHPGTDVFALGCVLYEGITGEALYGGLEMSEVYGISASRERFESFMARRFAQPAVEPFRELLERMCGRNPNHRIEASAVAQRCDALIADLGASAPLRQWCREHPWPETEPAPRSKPPSVTPRPQSEPKLAPIRAELPKTPETLPTEAFEDYRPQDTGSAELLSTGSAGSAPTPSEVFVEVTQATGSEGTLAPSLPGLGATTVLSVHPRSEESAPRPTRPRLGWLLAALAGIPALLFAAGALLAALVLLFLLSRPPSEDTPLRPEPISVSEILPPESSLPEPKSEPPLANPAPREPRPTATRAIRFEGPSGEIAVDGRPLGKSNEAYAVARGEHTCTFDAIDADPIEFPCPIRPETTIITIPSPVVRLTVEGKFPVLLKGSEGQLFGPDRVPVNARYVVLADFGEGWKEAGDLEIGLGPSPQIRCSAVTLRCERL